MKRNRRLPVAFADLEPFAATWALECERDRFAKLMATDVGDLKTFFDAMLPRAEAIAAHLDRRGLDKLNAEERRLFHLVVTFAEVTYPIELGWSRTDIDDPVDHGRLTFGDGSIESPI
ncbi:MAG: hypothetical protein EXQ96_06595 [Alphaproteobacteria bacterium]|nr:hypothetical protein [Alphaproteobacteria bacterium]